VVALALLGCTGQIDGYSPPGGNAGASTGTGPASSSPESGPSSCGAERLPRVIRSLSSAQYQNTIAAVLPGAALKDVFSVSDRSADFSTNASIRRLDFNAARRLMENAETAAATIQHAWSGSYPCLSGLPDAACVRQVIEGVGRRLYREPLAATQIDKLLVLFQQHQASDPGKAAELVVSAMLSSPRLLFRKELGVSAGEPGGFELTSHELASAIAYTLTNTPPDSELLAAADADLLRDPVRLRAEIQRLLDSESGMRGLRSFVSELWGARDFLSVDKDPIRFPGLDATTRQQLLADFGDTVALIMRSASPTFAELLTSRSLIVRPGTNQLLGWGFAGVSDSGTPVVATEPGRLGLLTHPVIMATHAHPSETNPVARGHLISGKVLCIAIPPPPQAVTFPERSSDDAGGTLRQVIEAQHSTGACAGCHQLMDPVGYPFEVFDALGRLRTSDNGLPIDPSGAIIGSDDIDGSVQHVEELLTRIASSRSAQGCFARHALGYVAGVGDHECVRTRLANAFHEQQGNVPQLVVSILSSDAFLRRGAAPE
jgi:hypothetical protein